MATAKKQMKLDFFVKKSKELECSTEEDKPSSSTATDTIVEEPQVELSEEYPNDEGTDSGGSTSNKLPNAQKRIDLNTLEDGEPTQPRLAYFPPSKCGSQMRSFSTNYYNRYPFIEYSQEQDAAFCYACRIFPSQSGHASVEDVFTDKGFKNWKKIDGKIKKHSESKGHINAMASWGAWKQTQASQGVHTMLESTRQQQIEQNRKAVGTLARVAMLCAQQAIPLRGHRENSKTGQKTNRGNFLGILSLIEMESSETKQNLDRLPKNSSYRSKDAQNDLLEAAYTVSVTSIINDVKKSGMYSVIADEAREMSKTEQMSVCIRYVKGFEINERFIQFVDVHELDAHSLATTLADCLTSHGLRLQDCVSQCYDGASVMSGRLSGVQERFRQLTGSYCPYVHCHAHRLNLVLVDTCKSVPYAGEVIGLLEAVHRFITASTKRHDLFVNAQRENNLKVFELQQQSDTRWACKFKAITVFLHRFKELSETLERITESENRCEAAEARGLFIQLRSFKSIFTLNLLYDLLGKCNSLSLTLQDKTLTMANASKLIEATISAVEIMRSEEAHEEIMRLSKVMAEGAGIEIRDKPTRGTRVKTHPRGLGDFLLTESVGVSQAAKDERDFTTTYRRSMYEIIDKMSSEMKRRFVQNNDIIQACVACDPANPTSDRFLQLSDITPLVAKFSNLNINCNNLEHQVAVARQMFSTDMPHSTEEAMGQLHRLHTAFPDLLRFFQLVCTIPVSSATAERSFSTMKRVKTYLRATMGNRRLTNLCGLAIEQGNTSEMLQNPEEVVNEFAKKGRRLFLTK